jgi:hypothetical protein
MYFSALVIAVISGRSFLKFYRTTMKRNRIKNKFITLLPISCMINVLKTNIPKIIVGRKMLITIGKGSLTVFTFSVIPGK